MSLDEVVDDLDTVELRCSGGHLLGESLIPKGAEIVEGNLIQVACRACRKAEHPNARRVLHQFNVLGQQVRTVIVT